MPYLDENGLKLFWAKSKAAFANDASITTDATTGSIALKTKDGDTLSTATIPAATASAAGVMTKADKAKLDGIAEGATKDVVSDVAITIKQAGVAKGSFTLNQSSAATIELSDSSYTLPAATASTIGGVKVGKNLSVTADGTLSADAQQYTLPTASATTLGGVKVGENLSIASGVLSATDTTYSAATASTLGLVKVGSNLSISNGVLSLKSGASLGAATAATATAGNNSTLVATTAFVTTAISNAAVGAATFQGTTTAESDFSGAAYKKGWYWVCAGSFIFGDNTCEAGDMVFAVSDKGSAYSASDFNVVQANITSIPTSYIEALS